MKWALMGILVLLVACTQVPEPVYAPPTTVTLANCEATQGIGEHCSQTCDCLRPGECLNNICSLTKLTDNQSCMESSQCLSGYCTESHFCSRPDGPNASYSCVKTCRTRYTGDTEPCYTVCSYR